MVALWFGVVLCVVRIWRNVSAFLARVLGVKHAYFVVFRLSMIYGGFTLIFNTYIIINIYN